MKCNTRSSSEEFVRGAEVIAFAKSKTKPSKPALSNFDLAVRNFTVIIGRSNFSGRLASNVLFKEMKFPSIVLSFFASAAFVFAEVPANRGHIVVDQTTITFEKLKGYSVSNPGDQSGKAPAIFLSEADGASTINITPLIGKVKEASKTPEGIKALLTRFSDQYAKGSVEGRVLLKEASWGKSSGAYASFTDPKLKEEEKIPEGKFLKVTIGVFKIDGELFLARIFHNQKVGLENAVRVLKSVRIEAGGDDDGE
ncbi:hypothetical protein [Haloferula sp.]|uniref:hypothetical protein n=1 Tax=Haloferula sp. TaxID=2497595 RepID=UPI00329C2FF8